MDANARESIALTQARLRAILSGCGFQPQNHRLEADATSKHRLQAGSCI